MDRESRSACQRSELRSHRGRLEKQSRPENQEVIKNHLMIQRLIFCSILSCGLVTFAADEKSARGYGPEAAREELKKMTTAEGVAVTLFASEPQLVNPADMDVDAR